MENFRLRQRRQPGDCTRLIAAANSNDALFVDGVAQDSGCGEDRSQLIGQLRQSIGDVQPVVRDVVLRLPATFDLTVRVADAAGQPRANANLRLLPDAEGGETPLPTTGNSGQKRIILTR